MKIEELSGDSGLMVSLLSLVLLTIPPRESTRLAGPI